MKTALKSFLRGQIVNLFLMSVDKNKTDILRTRLKGVGVGQEHKIME